MPKGINSKWTFRFAFQNFSKLIIKRVETTLNANVGSGNLYVPSIRNFLGLVISHSVNELAASRHKLLSSAAQIFADRWAHMSDTAILSAFLSGCPSLSYDENKALFLLVQTFILDSNRFYVT